MILSELYRYPLKAGAGEKLNCAEMLPTGIAFDRRWMVVSESGRFISQRERGAQRLALVECIVGDSEVRFRAPGAGELNLPIHADGGSKLNVELHGKALMGVDCGDAAAEWFSNYLPPRKGERYRLVTFPRDFVRSVRGLYTDRECAVTEFADGYPVTIANVSSLELLNQELVKIGVAPVKMNVFRPTIVVSGLKAWEEDRLRQIRIDDVVLEIVKPSERCPVTGVTQETGEFSEVPQEPRATLKRIHAGRDLLPLFPMLPSELMDKPMFSQNAIVLQPGTIREGSEVQILSWRD